MPTAPFCGQCHRDSHGPHRARAPSLHEAPHTIRRSSPAPSAHSRPRCPVGRVLDRVDRPSADTPPRSLGSVKFPDSRFAFDLSERISRSGTSCAIAIGREASYWEVAPPGVNDVRKWGIGTLEDGRHRPPRGSSTGTQQGAPGRQSPTTATRSRARGLIGANAAVRDQTFSIVGKRRAKSPAFRVDAPQLWANESETITSHYEKTPQSRGSTGHSLGGHL
jgi:hypothetical protein